MAEKKSMREMMELPIQFGAGMTFAAGMFSLFDNSRAIQKVIALAGAGLIIGALVAIWKYDK